MTPFLIACHALVLLSHEKTRLNSRCLAERVCTNAAEVRGVMSALSQAHIVKTTGGRFGGYELIRPTDEISLAEVAAAISANFMYGSWYSSYPESDCAIASGMVDWAKRERKLLEQAIQDFLATQSVADIESSIFGD